MVEIERPAFVGQCRNVSDDGKEIHDSYGFRPRHLDYMWSAYLVVWLFLSVVVFTLRVREGTSGLS